MTAKHTATKFPWHVNAISNGRVTGDATAKAEKYQICGSNATVATVYRQGDAAVLGVAPELADALHRLLSVTSNPQANPMDKLRAEAGAREALEKANWQPATT